jgi:hypothetical protein
LHPNGGREENKNHLGLYLFHFLSSSVQFKVRYRFEIPPGNYTHGEIGKTASECGRSWGPPKFIHHDKLFKKEGQYVVNGKLTIAVQVKIYHMMLK